MSSVASIYGDRAETLISVLQLGTIDYATGLRLQELLVELRKNGGIGDVLLLLEHTPVITLGRNAHSRNIVASAELLARRGVEVFECNRGGDVTFHGPGQLVAYPIFDLHGFPSRSANGRTMGVIEFVRSLEETVIRTCAELGIPAKRISGLTGVWTSEGAPSCTDLLPTGLHNRLQPPEQPSMSEAKIAALGVHISRGVSSHGIALNVNTDLSFFNLIVPCGITSKPITSIAKELGRDVPMQELLHALARNFGGVFGSQVLWLDSLEALRSTHQGVAGKLAENLRRPHGQDDTAWT